MVRHTYSPLIEGDTIRCTNCGKTHIVEHSKEARHKKTAPLYYICNGGVFMADKNIKMNGLFA